MFLHNETGVSVIVCCYNSAERLPETLKNLAHQKVSENLLWEVIIVDNNSTDSTSLIAQQEWNIYKLNIPIKIIKEPQAGLSYARKKGFTEAKYELLIFCDDDNWLEENYISYAFEIMNGNSRIAILGGRSEGCFEKEKPFWFDKFEKAYAVGKPLPESGIANSRAYIAGAAMVTRKSLLQSLYQLNFQPLLTGRKGNRLTSGEDSEISLLFLFMGYNLYYDERLQFTHFIPAKRLSWKYCVSMIAKGHAIPQVYFELYNYSFKKIRDKETIAFKDAYTVIKKRSLKKVLKNLFPLWVSLENVIKSQHGLKKEIEIKAALNKIKYIVSNKNKLKHEFDIMCSLLYKIEEVSYEKCLSRLQNFIL